MSVEPFLIGPTEEYKSNTNGNKVRNLLWILQKSLKKLNAIFKDTGLTELG